MENKTIDAEALAKELLLDKKNGFFRVDDEEIAKADAFCEDYKKFLDKGKTEREAAAEAIRLAEEKGVAQRAWVRAGKNHISHYFGDYHIRIYLGCRPLRTCGGA